MDVQRLAKVLALAASDNEAEATGALRTANRLLEAAGMDFVGLANQLAGGSAGADSEVLKNAVFDLRNEVRHLRAENEKLRQGRDAPPGAHLHSAAQDAAQVIRLKAEVSRLADMLDEERVVSAASRAAEADAANRLAEAVSEAGALAARLEETEARKRRLEVEVKRLTTIKEALQSEISQRNAAAERFEAELLSVKVRDNLQTTTVSAVKAPRRRKAAAEQISLF